MAKKLEKYKKLDLSKWDKKDQVYVEELKAVLEAQDFNLVDKHITLAMKAPRGIQDDFHLEEPATYTLLAYGSIGLEALYKLSLSDPRASGRYDAPRALLTAALKTPHIAIQHMWLCHRYIDDKSFENLVKKIEENCSSQDLAKEARRYISRIVRFFISEPDYHYELGNLIMKAEFLFSDKDEKKKAISFIMELIAEGSLNINEEICKELEELITQDLEENIYQNFFKEHSAILDPLASSILNQQTLADMWRTDFVIRRLDDEYIFVEIKSPRERPFTNYPHPSRVLSHAIGQITNWYIWVEDNINYARSHGFPGIHSPRGIIVIGRDADLNDSQTRMLKSLNDLLSPRVRILTYDNVIQNAKNIVRNITAK